MTDFTPALNPQQSRTGKPDVRWRQLMFNHFLRTSAWLALHILLLVGYLTLVFAMGVNWLTSLAIFFVAGLAIGLSAGALALSGCSGSSPLSGGLSNPFAQGTSDFDLTFLSASSTWDMNKDGVVTCDEWKQYSGELLRESDGDGDLALTQQEWGTLVGKDKLFVTANHDYYDVNKDGKVALVELTERPNHAFKLLDKDKDCQLGHAEKANVYSVTPEKSKAVDPSQMPGGPGGR